MPESEGDGYGGEAQHEYRIFGHDGGWRVTEWEDRESAVQKYEECDWAIFSFERREVGDDSTIERCPDPEDEEWQLVTEDKTHLKDEEVAKA